MLRDAHGSGVSHVRARRLSAPGTIGSMATSSRVCPFCGEPPGPGMFCEACGRNLAQVDRLPTRDEWRAGHSAEPAPPDGRPPAERCAAATTEFLAAMRAAGEPGRTSMPAGPRKAFGRTPQLEGWTIRPVHREDEASSRGYVPGLFLTTDGAYHRLDNEVRGWGQRDFPRYEHEAAPEPLPPPADERLVAELAAVLEDNGVTPAFGHREERC
jgi:hypothetical protein